MDLRGSLRTLLVGFLIGIAFVLPGVSGAVIAVVFGIYERMIFVLSDLKRNLKAELRFVIVLALGLVIGMVVFSALFNRITDEYGSIILLAFIGLIIGQVPEVWMLARKDDGPVRGSYMIWIAAGMIVMLLILLLDQDGIKEISADHSITNIVLAAAVGLIMGSTGIVPGMSGPTILTAVGLYGLFTGVLGDFDLILLIPMGVGAVIGAIFVSKIMMRLLQTHYYPLYYAILGLTVGSIIVTFFEVDPGVNIAFGAAALIAGLAVSLLFTYCEKFIPEQSSEGPP